MPSAAAVPVEGTHPRDALRTERAHLFAQFSQHASVQQLVTRLVRAVDRVLVHPQRKEQMLTTCALVAVGGYGRDELFPHFDMDILLLLLGTTDKALRAWLEAFIGRCQDTGSDIGSSMHTVGERIRETAQGVTMHTSLLEACLLTGNERLYHIFETHYQGHLDTADFFQLELLEMHQWYTKYQDTPYSLEPNCKESSGSLRDLQAILWMTHAAGFDSSWSELLTSGLLTCHEAQELTGNEHLLKTACTRLYLPIGHRRDVSVSNLQTQLTEPFGYHPTTARHASEQLIHRYYWVTRATTQLNTVVLQSIKARLFLSRLGITRRTNDHFVERQGMFEVTNADLYQREPTAVLETFPLYERTRGIKGLTASTMRTPYNTRALMDAEWRRGPANCTLFLSILQQPQGITHTPCLMNQTSVLGRYLVNFRRIVGQMQHDLFHIYTVNQHILMMVCNVRHFTIVKHTHEFPFYGQLMANFGKPWVLIVAALFHDIAKGRGGDHSVLDMSDARRFCEKHSIVKEDADLII